ncbi:MAG: thioredoxin 1 [Candidatus Berkelbacteria bacterium Licking1014_7]|uniref:Thioredoxin 1 n=1 Tax=Candidatus Berkelbacteria bacterium Licking1014_7 TaxID=2017147 RepID=A0A554LID6_9BACT|nr:MAG: thioredoxin 1 [Candidatus Berkelbacteria bacterium Licking1014_7]
MPTKSKPELVQFYSDWCGPCQAMKPIIAEIKKEMGDKITVTRYNVDKDAEKTQKYNIMSIPTFLIKKDGKVIKQLVGMQSKKKLIKKLSV